MGRRTRDQNVLNQFCYYCDKEYEHKDTLLEHQKNRHFSCLRCQKKFSTAVSVSTHMLSVHRETLAKVPNAKIGRDNIDTSIYGMEGVPAIIIQEKMIAKLKKKRQKLQEDIQKKTNLSSKLDPKNVKELKESNGFFEVFKNYTGRIEAAAGLRQYTEQPKTFEPNFPPPPPPGEDHKQETEKKRESKFSSKYEEEKAGLPLIMKEEMKNMVMKEQHEQTSIQPSINLNLPKVPSKDSSKKKKAKQEIMIFVSKLSAEEKRAQMEKYKYDEKKITKELSNLKLSIQDKLAAIQSKFNK